MSLSVRYLIQKSSGQQTLDFRANKAKYTLDGVAYFYTLNGKEYAVTGSSAVDNIWVAPGSKIDATALLGDVDNIYLSGRWADYTKTLNSEKGTITFSREVGGQTESVTVGNGVIGLTRDNLVFADGTVDTRAARLALEASTTPALDASRTSQSPVAQPQAGDSLVRGLSRESGVNFALPSVGLTHVLAGSSGEDQIYVTPGATVDAVALLGGTDRIFLTGKWSDYTKTLAPEKGAIIFTREINGQTEKVSVANGLIGLGKDMVVFADGAVRTDTIRVTLADKGPGATVADLIAEGAKTATTTADDWTNKTFTRWDVTPPAIDVVAGDDRVNRSEKDAGVTVFGVAEAGGTVSVTWGGVTKTVRAKEDGTWAAKFESSEVPAEGASTITATVTDQGGNSSDASSRKVNVDSVAPVGAVINTVAGDNAINGKEKNNGVTVTGTAEPGSTIEVGFGGTPKSVVADQNGNWSVPLGKDDLPADGKRDLTVTVRDPAGNSTTSTHPVTVDSAPPAMPVIGQVAGDDMVSYTERASGVTVTGKAEAGSQVKLTWGGGEKTVAADANGNWSANFLRAEIPVSGKQDLRAVAVDAAGNESAVATRTVTSQPNPPAPTINVIAGDDRINAGERAAGVTLSGTALPGLMVLVGLYRPNGSKINEYQVTANEQGVWSLPLGSAELPAFGDFSVTAETRDTVTGHGSLDSGQRSVNVDVSAPALPVLNVVAGDDKVNGSEKATGVVVSGTAESGSTVSVSWGGQNKSLTADVNGQWSVTFAPGEVPADGSSTVSVKATDLAGNVSPSVTRAVTVDSSVAVPVIDVIAQSNFVWEGSPETKRDADVVNAAEKNAGVTVTGSAEVGSMLKLEWGSQTKTTTVGQDGKWSVTFPANEVPVDGNYTLKA
ncbi:Ig-like domain-containing protein, partial [Pseudomonas sp. LAMO17WK12:I9]|uniref:Ig-like domain-containing protein n=1 Tax=Pseudomonas sp. LAMO17WK12:I9 TaxID=1286370 RepID=UPI000D8A832F